MPRWRDVPAYGSKPIWRGYLQEVPPHPNTPNLPRAQKAIVIPIYFPHSKRILCVSMSSILKPFVDRMSAIKKAARKNERTRAIKRKKEKAERKFANYSESRFDSSH